MTMAFALSTTGAFSVSELPAFVQYGVLGAGFLFFLGAGALAVAAARLSNAGRSARAEADARLDATRELAVDVKRLAERVELSMRERDAAIENAFLRHNDACAASMAQTHRSASGHGHDDDDDHHKKHHSGGHGHDDDDDHHHKKHHKGGHGHDDDDDHKKHHKSGHGHDDDDDHHHKKHHKGGHGHDDDDDHKKHHSGGHGHDDDDDHKKHHGFFARMFGWSN